jgi:hypothetical protein
MILAEAASFSSTKVLPIFSASSWVLVAIITIIYDSFVIRALTLPQSFENNLKFFFQNKFCGNYRIFSCVSQTH